MTSFQWMRHCTALMRRGAGGWCVIERLRRELIGVLSLRLVVSATDDSHIFLYVTCGVEDLEDAELFLAIVDDSQLNGKSCSYRNMVEAALPLLSFGARSFGGDGQMNLSLLAQ